MLVTVDATCSGNGGFGLHTFCMQQRVVTNILAVLISSTGIKVRSNSQAVKLETIKQSRSLFTLLNQRQEGFVL